MWLNGKRRKPPACSRAGSRSELPLDSAGPGQLLRTAVLRLIRPYIHFEARAHRHHLQSTQRIIECLRSGVPPDVIEQRAGSLQGRDDSL